MGVDVGVYVVGGFVLTLAKGGGKGKEEGKGKGKGRGKGEGNIEMDARMDEMK